MSLFKKISSIIFLSTTVLLSSAQGIPEKDSAQIKADTMLLSINRPIGAEKVRFPVKELILPAAMVTYGVVSLNNIHLKKINKDLNRSIGQNSVGRQIHLDHYLVLVPAAGAIALEFAGINGKNNLKTKMMIYFMSSVFTNTTVFTLKKSIQSLRPDESNSNSFPSAHTAQAFASAEFLRKEYKNVSGWYGVAGYTIAITTGYLRMYNNKHWLSDVLAGAGIGIASTKLAYWLYPKIQHWFFKNKSANTAILPFYNNGSLGISMTHIFNP